MSVNGDHQLYSQYFPYTLFAQMNLARETSSKPEVVCSNTFHMSDGRCAGQRAFFLFFPNFDHHGRPLLEARERHEGGGQCGVYRLSLGYFIKPVCCHLFKDARILTPGFQDITCQFGLFPGARTFEREGPRFKTALSVLDLSSANFLSPQTFRELSTVSFQLYVPPSGLSLERGTYAFALTRRVRIYRTHSLLS